MLKLLFIARHRKSLVYYLVTLVLLMAQWPVHQSSAQMVSQMDVTPSEINTAREPNISTVASPFAYPVPDDSTFVSSSSSQLGQYVSSGYIDFYIPINRVFTTKPVKDAVSKGILPEFSELTISFYANEPKYCWPMHRITLNGHDLPWVMPRADGQWLLTTIPFPTIYLEKLPKQVHGAPPQPEWQKVRIYVDTAYCQCGLQVQWGSIKINAARPVMFVHGWTGNPSSWLDFTNLLDEDGMPYVSADLADGIKPIPTTGALLAGQVHDALVELGVQKINLIAHSKGGLFARWALDNDLAPVVERLITLGAPHHGVDDARLVIAKANNCPQFGSSDPFSSDECQISADETSISHVRDDMNYANCKISSSLGGLPTYTDCVRKVDPQPDVAYYSIVGNEDMFVENASSTYPWRADNTPYPLSTNVDVVLAGRGHFSLKASRRELNCAMGFINPRAYSPASCDGQMQGAAMESKQPLLDLVNQTHLQSFDDGQLIWVTHTLASLSQTFPIYIDAATSVKILVNAEQTLTVSLKSPNGQSIVPARADTNFVANTVTYYTTQGAIASERDWGAEYRLTAPQSGWWVINIDMPTGITSPLRLALGAWVSSSVQLQTAFDKSIYHPGQTVRLTATLINAGHPATPSSQLAGRVMGNVAVALAFVDDGSHGDATANDGVYTAQFTAPTPTTTPYFPIEINASQGALHRQVFAELAVNPDSGRIESTTPITFSRSDPDQDQSYADLTVSPAIYISRTGHFRLEGRLAHLNGTTIAFASTASLISGAPWSTGHRIVPLHFDGKQIRRHGIDGPYRLVDLQLFDENTSAILIDSLSTDSNQTTPAYAYRDFRGADPVISGLTHQAIDTDDNGRYNQLLVTVTLSGTTAGNYLWGGWLVDAQGGHIARASGQGNLADDQAVIQFAFDAPAIRLNAQDGPYHLAEIMLQPVDAAGYYRRLIWLTTSYGIPAYRYSQFDDELATRVADTPDLSTRQSSVNFYHQEYPSNSPAIGWTGNLTDCVAGDTAPVYQAALLQRVPVMPVIDSTRE